jgi:DNA invertase Pin-like site-specific DNA recombinase
VGRFDLILGAGWTVLPLIPFTTPHNRGLRISAFCGELQKAEFEGNVIRKRTLAGLKAARARGRVGGRPEKLSVRDKQQIRAAAQRPPKFASRTLARRFGVSVGTMYKQVGAVAPEK